MNTIKKSWFRSLAIVTLVTFSVTNFSFGQNLSIAAAHPEVALPMAPGLSQAVGIQVPEKLATLDLFHAGRSKTIFHIQNAHGNYQGEKQTEALLQFLKEKYGVETIFSEGAWNKLNPELIRFDSDEKKNADILDKLTKNAIVKGFETHLLNSPESTGYGIEEEALYNQGLKAFAEVQVGRSKHANELAAIETALEARQTKIFSSDLRTLVKRIEKHRLNEIPFDAYLQELKTLTQKHFRLDLGDATLQTLYPQLVRIYKIEELEKKIDSAQFEKEKINFLKTLHAVLGTRQEQTINEVERLLALKDLSANLPDPATAEFFIHLVQGLPANFDYKKYSNVTSLFGLLILRSEIHADQLMAEIEKLETELMNQLATTDDAKNLMKEIQGWWLKKKLINLELTPSEYEILARMPETGDPRSDSSSSGVTRGLSRGDAEVSSEVAQLVLKSARSDQHESLITNHKALQSIASNALNFYAIAKQRDTVMLRRIEERLQETQADKVAVVTGGFHSGPFADYFKQRGYSYAQITPKITEFNLSDRDNYVNVMMTFAKQSFAKTIDHRLQTIDQSDAVIASKTKQSSFANVSTSQQMPEDVTGLDEHTFSDFFRHSGVNVSRLATRQFATRKSSVRSQSEKTSSVARMNRKSQTPARLGREPAASVAPPRSEARLNLITKTEVTTSARRSEGRRDYAQDLEKALKQTYVGVLLDIDGTLKARGEKISDEILKDLYRLLLAGVPVGIATGNAPEAVTNGLAVEIKKWIISQHGKSDKEVRELLHGMTVYGFNGAVAVNVGNGQKYYEKDFHTLTGKENHFYKVALLEEKGFQSDFSERDINVDWHSHGFHISDKPDLELARRLNAFFKKKGFPLEAKVSDKDIDVYPTGVNKGLAVAHMAARLGVEPNKIVKIGDRLQLFGNDGGFTDEAGFSVDGFDPENKLQIAMSEANHMRGPPATHYLLERLKFHSLDQSLAQAYHFFGNIEAFQIWMKDVVAISGKTENDIRNELSTTIQNNRDSGGPVYRYGEIPEERWIYLLGMIKFANQHHSQPFFIERGAHLYGRLWPVMVARLKELGLVGADLEASVTSEKILWRASSMPKQYNPQKHFYVMAASFAALMTNDEWQATLSDTDKDQLRAAWGKMTGAEKMYVSTYLKGWGINSFETWLKQNISRGEFIKKIADAGVAPEYVLAQARLDPIVGVIERMYLNGTAADGKPLPLSLAEVLAGIKQDNEKLHPMLRFNEKSWLAVEKLFQEEVFKGQQEIGRDHANFFESRFWVSFIEGYLKEYDLARLGREGGYAVQTLMESLVASTPSLARFRGKSLVFLDENMGTGATAVMARIFGRALSPDANHGVGMFFTRKENSTSGQSLVDFAINRNVLAREDFPENSAGSYEETDPDTAWKDSSSRMVLRKNQLAALINRYETQIDDAQRRRLRHYQNEVSAFLKQHTADLHQGLVYFGRARKVKGLLLEEELLKIYLSRELPHYDEMRKMIVDQLFQTYGGELTQVQWDLRTKINSDIETFESRLAELEKTHGMVFTQLRESAKQLSLASYGESLKKIRKLYDAQIKRQNQGLKLLDDLKVQQVVRNYLDGTIADKDLAAAIFKVADFKPFIRSEARKMDLKSLETVQNWLAGLNGSDFFTAFQTIILSFRPKEYTAYNFIKKSMNAYGFKPPKSVSLKIYKELVILERKLRILDDTQRKSLAGMSMLDVPGLVASELMHVDPAYLGIAVTSKRLEKIYWQESSRTDPLAHRYLYFVMEMLGKKNSKLASLPRGEFSKANNRLQWIQHRLQPAGYIGNFPQRAQLIVDQKESIARFYDQASRRMLKSKQVLQMRALIERECDIFYDSDQLSNVDHLPDDLTFQKMREFLAQVDQIYDPKTGKRRSELRIPPASGRGAKQVRSESRSFAGAAVRVVEGWTGLRLAGIIDKVATAVKSLAAMAQANSVANHPLVRQIKSELAKIPGVNVVEFQKPVDARLVANVADFGRRNLTGLVLAVVSSILDTGKAVIAVQDTNEIGVVGLQAQFTAETKRLGLGSILNRVTIASGNTEALQSKALAQGLGNQESFALAPASVIEKVTAARKLARISQDMIDQTASEATLLAWAFVQTGTLDPAAIIPMSKISARYGIIQEIIQRAVAAAQTAIAA